MIFIADLIACSTCFGHHYAHHQELESIIQKVAARGIWCFGFQVVGMVWNSAPHHTDNLKTKAPNTTGSSLLYNTLEPLMMGIMVPETCWESNKICNKNHLLHLVGILFPHINDDARSKSLQIKPVHTSPLHMKIKYNVIPPSTSLFPSGLPTEIIYLYHFYSAPATCSAPFFSPPLLSDHHHVSAVFNVSKNHISALAPMSVRFITKNVNSINISYTTPKGRTQLTVSRLHRK